MPYPKKMGHWTYTDDRFGMCVILDSFRKAFYHQNYQREKNKDAARSAKIIKEITGGDPRFDPGELSR